MSFWRGDRHRILISRLGDRGVSAGAGNRGTICDPRKWEYAPPGGAAWESGGFNFWEGPEFTMREDLRRFKALLEMREIPTTEGQPHGPRSAVISAVHAVYPARRKPTEYSAGERVAAQGERHEGSLLDGNGEDACGDGAGSEDIDSRDAIVRITRTCICGSDLHLYNGFMPTMERRTYRARVHGRGY